MTGFRDDASDLPDDDWLPRTALGDPVFPAHLLQEVTEDRAVVSPLSVNVEFMDLLEHCMGNEAEAYRIIGELKDLLG